MKRFRYKFAQFRKRLGPRVTAYFIMALITAFCAEYFDQYVPKKVVEVVGDVNVNSILNSLVGTMLTISTFAVSTTVGANSSAVASTTPRAFRLILQDSRTQRMLVVFLGSFAFSATILILMPLGSFVGGGRVILFGVLVYLLVNIIFNFIRWTMSIRELGSLGHTINKIEGETLKTFNIYWKDPLSGANHFTDKTLPSLEEMSPIYGYNGRVIQVIDEEQLNDIGEKEDIEIFVNVLEGDLINYDTPLAWVRGYADEQLKDRIRRGFLVDASRDISVDGRFGLVMLQETASKALSSAINDAGTANACIQSSYRILSIWPEFSEARMRYPQVWKRSVSLEKLMKQFYRPIARDAGNTVSVHGEIMTSLLALSKRDVQDVQNAAKATAIDCMGIAEQNLRDENDIETVRGIFKQIAQA